MKASVPELVTMPDRKVLSVTSIGDPNKVGEKVFQSLYGAAYGTKFKTFKPRGIKMEIGKLAALWPDAHLKPKDQWTGIWTLTVPDYVTEADVVQKIPDSPAKLDVLKGGLYAQILHKGPYTEEGPNIKILHDFIEANGVNMADIPGTHEEEYLTRPGVKDMKTIIRYRIK